MVAILYTTIGETTDLHTSNCLSSQFLPRLESDKGKCWIDVMQSFGRVECSKHFRVSMMCVSILNSNTVEEFASWKKHLLRNITTLTNQHLMIFNHLDKISIWIFNHLDKINIKGNLTTLTKSGLKDIQPLWQNHYLRIFNHIDKTSI